VEHPRRKQQGQATAEPAALEKGTRPGFEELVRVGDARVPGLRDGPARRFRVSGLVILPQRHQSSSVVTRPEHGVPTSATARIWREENIDTRINDTPATEALGTGAGVIACPYCNVMLGDAVNAKKASGQARRSVEVIDVAQLLVRAVKLRQETEDVPGDTRTYSE
jgi:hypothetical protein